MHFIKTDNIDILHLNAISRFTEYAYKALQHVALIAIFKGGFTLPFWE